MIQQTAVIALYDIHRLDFLMAGRPVLCEVQIAALYMSINFVFQNDKKRITQSIKLCLNLVSPYQKTPSLIGTLNTHPFLFDYIKTNINKQLEQ